MLTDQGLNFEICYKLQVADVFTTYLWLHNTKTVLRGSVNLKDHCHLFKHNLEKSKANLIVKKPNPN